MQNIEINDSSFRDNCGFVFNYQGKLYRQVNVCFADEFDAYLRSGLHQELINNNYLVNHDEQELEGYQPEQLHKILAPEVIPYISYPYEWCFSQLKDAALLTLNIQLLALKYGFSLKDANAFNIQFYQGRPIFIDTLSFEQYQQGTWVAYRQFCQHFLAPLVLKVHCDHRLGKLAELYIDGLPLDLTSRLLPKRTWLNFNILSHIHLHAKVQNYYGNKPQKSTTQLNDARTMTKEKLQAMLQGLKTFVQSLHWQGKNSEWGQYYQHTNYHSDAMKAKHQLIEHYLNRRVTKANTIADIGANTGRFSRLAGNYAEQVVAFDIDEVAVEFNYQQICKDGESNILPLVLDLFNPSASIGWANCERSSFISRGSFDVVIALALIHHLAISNNTPLKHIIRLLHHITQEQLIIEFVPKEDSQTKRLLATRKDVFPEYHKAGFEAALKGYFKIDSRDDIPNSSRTLYCLTKVF
ncbi:class I SAM-dependent methyltransferase [Vibrio natriegens]|uniref:class I SAM-dependent methyltransferase n=1 Tax=Vibrio natriegens TaxID=691 RepID=UPI001FBB3B47|nr:class I SAM-dependent methyltransferase [Vibrio natriegens]